MADQEEDSKQPKENLREVCKLLLHMHASDPEPSNEKMELVKKIPHNTLEFSFLKYIMSNNSKQEALEILLKNSEKLNHIMYLLEPDQDDLALSNFTELALILRENNQVESSNYVFKSLLLFQLKLAKLNKVTVIQTLLSLFPEKNYLEIVKAKGACYFMINSDKKYALSFDTLENDLKEADEKRSLKVSKIEDSLIGNIAGFKTNKFDLIHLNELPEINYTEQVLPLIIKTAKKGYILLSDLKTKLKSESLKPFIEDLISNEKLDYFGLDIDGGLIIIFRSQKFSLEDEEEITSDLFPEFCKIKSIAYYKKWYEYQLANLK